MAYRNATVEDTEVLPSCDKSEGCWKCLTHDETFPNNMQVAGHVDRGEHIIAWLCFEHGPEAVV